MKEELNGIERYRATKERLLGQASSNLEAMQTTRSGLESELHQVLIIRRKKLFKNFILLVYQFTLMYFKIFRN